MTLQEAYLKAKNAAKGDGLTLLTSCNDYGDVWGFEFMPPTYNPKDPGTRIGGGYDVIINKKTGEATEYNPFLDGFDLLGKAKPIPLKQISGITPTAPTAAKKLKRAATAATAS
ncbi:hypothetical protein R80B4_01196 [Fibrobacteres bacterium R8-0-B4]